MKLPAVDQALHDGIVAATGAAQRRALAKAITLLESTRAVHRERPDLLLQALQPRTGGSFRLGISGVPGVGKSTFIEAFGCNLLNAGKKVAVLAVDPTSPLTGGSILGERCFASDVGDAQAGAQQGGRIVLVVCFRKNADIPSACSSLMKSLSTSSAGFSSNPLRG